VERSQLAWSSMTKMNSMMMTMMTIVVEMPKTMPDTYNCTAMLCDYYRQLLDEMMIQQ
jgi:hypothetical protein